MKFRERPLLFPIFLDLRDKLCTIIGAGEVAARRANKLLEASATVRVIAPNLCASMKALLGNEKITYLKREFQPGDLNGSALVFAATDDQQVNAIVYKEARLLGLPVNTVDDPSNCDFVMPAVLERDPITIAISTSGASPALARHLREKISQAVPDYYQQFARLLGQLREEGPRNGTPESRALLWRKLLESEVLALLRNGKTGDAEKLARHLLNLPQRTSENDKRASRLVIGSRGSKLALIQAEIVAIRLCELGIASEVRIIRTLGDRRQHDFTLPPGAFVCELELVLQHKEIDIAVHSLKDLPTGNRTGLSIAAILPRENPRDALISSCGLPMSDLPAGSKIGTGSIRRSAQLRTRYPHLDFIPIRGNVDTRIGKMERGEYDALVLALAGLLRLGLAHLVTEIISPDICLPAPGQGALALQIRKDDEATRHLLRPLDHPASRYAVTAERAFLHHLGGGCSLPVGALATVAGDRLRLRAEVNHPTNPQTLRRVRSGRVDNAADIGRSLADLFLAIGAGAFLAQTVEVIQC